MTQPLEPETKAYDVSDTIVTGLSLFVKRSGNQKLRSQIRLKVCSGSPN